MASFEKITPSPIKVEGGISDRKDDYGGLTKYGISERAYPHVDIANLTETQALMILKQDYWDQYRLDSVTEQTIANQCFFLLINMNPEKATLIIQRAINACGRKVIVTEEDGILGSETVKAINSLAPYWLSDRIRVESCRYYLNLVDHDLSQDVNFRGWIRRALI